MFKRTEVALLAALLSLTAGVSGSAEDSKSAPAERPKKRLLLIGQGPDSHPWGTHEYLAGMRILAQCLTPASNIQTIIVSADGPWKEGPELIDGADGIVLFVSEGARWIHDDRRRLAALQQLAARGGGLVCWHWGMGCRDAKYISQYLKLFGGCHGGPDRKHKEVKNANVRVAAREHAILRGINDFTVDEELYYRLKLVKPAKSVVPLLRARIDGRDETVSWAWERPDGGRSFGFSGGHFHSHWEREEYRRLIAQAVLWTIDVPVPDEGLPLKISKKNLSEPRPKPAR